MVLKLLVDTCVWLALAKDYREQPVIRAFEDLIQAGSVELIVPQVVLDEFDRNKGRVIAETRRSLRVHFRLAREAVAQFADDDRKAETVEALTEVDHRLGVRGEANNDSINRIEALLRAAPVVPLTDTVKRRVTERALASKAPYHRDRNSVGDAILIEMYAELVSRKAARSVRYAFLTLNFKDFSEVNGDHRKPHPDLRQLFSARKSTYWISAVDLIKHVDAYLLDDYQAEFAGFDQPRRLSEILEAEELFFKQIWYNRHWNLRTRIENGTHHLVTAEEYASNPHRHDQTLDTVWAGALAAAKKTEKEVGLDNLGPWDDFDWGMINGKLSALRWVLGDEWDMLDT
jgi:hypothetical protein